MKMPERYMCDLCDAEIENYEVAQHKRTFHVITNCNWTDGAYVGDYVTLETFDVCEECLMKATNIRCGFRGQNPCIISEKVE